MTRTIQIVYKKDNGADEKTYYIDKHKKWLPQEFELDMILVQEQTGESEREFAEVVRCKDCKHKLKNENDDDYYCETMWIDFMVNGLTDNDYCSSGERRAK